MPEPFPGVYCSQWFWLNAGVEITYFLTKYRGVSLRPCVRKVWGVETLWLVLRRANTPFYYNIDQTYSYHCWLKFAESLKSALGKIFFWHICRIICLHRALHYKCKSWIFFDWAMITGMFSTILPHIRSFSQTVLS